MTEEMSMQELINWMPGYDWLEPEEPPESEKPQIQNPYCPICGSEMEFDDTHCWNCDD